MATKDRPSDPRSSWATLSQAERDAAYDNNAVVKNSAALIAERNQLFRNAARQPQVLS
jgi:arylformamidase